MSDPRLHALVADRPPLILYLAGRADRAETETRLRQLYKGRQVEFRDGVSGSCDDCGFVWMKDATTGAFVVDNCVCEINATHEKGCHLRTAVNSPIDVGCNCEMDSCKCRTCFRCTCESAVR